MKNVKLTKKEIEFILWNLDSQLESSRNHQCDGIDTYKTDDYGDIMTQEDLNIIKSLKNKLE